ncbi:reticulon-4-interacting protein 1 [Colletotrichum fioriniae PJ7]|uniref:Reticulon-4-interacting protein 1 n=1 Tax=Colletotrichum fioriniae PJ7 TaxID=1445577 RepID=A0A010RTA8_9PEZI|nr:reticulon-4-interacting protein 1 [Colletotrichum fioriniae PJ7]
MEVMRAWQYSKVGRLEENLQLKTDIPRPTAETLQEDQVLVQVLCISLISADLKHVELEVCVHVPEGVLPHEAAGIGGAGLTAYQSIIPFIQKGQKVFINDESGGVGLLAIQIARPHGIDVTVSCSMRNKTLYEELGAHVIDYTRGDLVNFLQRNGVMFDLIVDNVGNDHRLFEAAHLYTTIEAKFIQVGGELKTLSIVKLTQRVLLPSFLSGGKQNFQILAADSNVDYLAILRNPAAEKQPRLSLMINEELNLERVIHGIRKLRTGLARGKIIMAI